MNWLAKKWAAEIVKGGRMGGIPTAAVEEIVFNTMLHVNDMLDDVLGDGAPDVCSEDWTECSSCGTLRFMGEGMDIGDRGEMFCRDCRDRRPLTFNPDPV